MGANDSEVPAIPLVVAIGLPASGKSSFARAIAAATPGTIVVSTDAIRAQLFGDEAVQGPWREVWGCVETQLRAAVTEIRAGTCPGAIYDATNVVRRNRRDVLRYARAWGFTRITGLLCETPLEVCLIRNQRRSRVVPRAAIETMARKLAGAPPDRSEGFDRLLVYRWRERPDG